MKIEKLLENSLQSLASPEIYWQSLAIIFCFFLAYLCHKLSRKFFLPLLISRSLRKNIELNRLIIRYLAPMFYPVFAIGLLTFGFSIYAQFFTETLLFNTTIKLVGLFLFLRFLRISSDSTIIANLVGLILMPTLILDVFGILDAAIKILDGMAFNIGEIRISAYIVIKAIITLILVVWLSGLITRKSKSFINGSKIKSSTKGILGKVLDILVYTAAFVVILKAFGVDMTAFAVIGGAIGVGIGFGLQKIASNFISGIILLLEKSIEVGDIVEVDGGKIYGTIKHFASRYTLVEELDGKEIMIPNEEFIINKVTNWTYSNNRARIEFNIRVAYNSDLEKVKEIMINCALENPRCLSYPEIEWYVVGFGEYDIRIIMYIWISDIVEGRFAPRSEVYMAIWKEFKKHNIEIPYPQREINLIKSEN
jgi:small-conductance mechanosensitive channel